MTLLFQHCGHDVISRRKVLLCGECSHIMCLVLMQQHLPVPDLYFILTGALSKPT